MSHDKEYIILLNHATHLHIDISTFPTVWAVLSILLDTQDNKLKYVKFLQVLQMQDQRIYGEIGGKSNNNTDLYV